MTLITDFSDSWQPNRMILWAVWHNFPLFLIKKKIVAGSWIPRGRMGWNGWLDGTWDQNNTNYDLWRQRKLWLERRSTDRVPGQTRQLPSTTRDLVELNRFLTQLVGVIIPKPKPQSHPRPPSLDDGVD